ncbi:MULTISPECIES: hypothetical protein [Burkholderia]|uniref:hypothetical protein n=1 Tax=Burkholderia TaxID=32008 RepID=UPI001F61EA7A|nr:MULTISPECIES: hypothetical protein [Burkholderia]MCI3970837.1 hypothetical protein [Burkholderia sp. HI4860]
MTTDKSQQRVFTYRHQPDNVGAWRLGEACRSAKPGGDPIDHGLSLLKELQAKGFGVVALDGAPPVPAGYALVPAAPTPEWVLRYCEFTNRDPVGTQHASSMDGWVESTFAQVAERELALAIQSAPPAPAPHADDLAVDRFSSVMKAKLAEKRAAGRGGWDDPKQCHVTTLARYLVEHVAKGDPVDVGNFAMMLHQRAAGPLVLPAALHVYTHPEPLKGGK